MILLKKVFAVILLIGITVLLCMIPFLYHAASRHMIAKIRYFDGSMDTIYITNWGTNGAAIWFTSIDGVTTTTGANNVIIIRGDKDE